MAAFAVCGVTIWRDGGHQPCEGRQMSALEKDVMLDTLDGECPLDVLWGKCSEDNSDYFGFCFFY